MADEVTNDEDPKAFPPVPRSPRGHAGRWDGSLINPGQPQEEQPSDGIQGGKLMRDAMPVRPPEDSTAVARVLMGIALCAVAIVTVWLLADVLLMVFMAAVIAVILRGVSRFAARRIGLSEAVTLTAVTVLIVLLLVGFFYYLAPQLFGQLHELRQQVQQEVGRLRQSYGGTTWGQLLLQTPVQPDKVQDAVVSYTRQIAASAVFSTVSTVVVIVVALYFAAAPEQYTDGIVKLFPLSWRATVKRLNQDIGRTLRWWSLGQSIDMLLVGLLTCGGLLVLHIPLALALGFIAGLFTFVPYFGGLAAAVPAFMVGLTVSWQSALWVVAVFVGAHTLEGLLVTPHVQRRAVHLPPAVTILSMTVMGTLFGPMGVILGTPLAATLLVIVREVYIGGILRDPEVLGDRQDE
jgi:predicted PurR-regulated permease PerM